MITGGGVYLNNEKITEENFVLRADISSKLSFYSSESAKKRRSFCRLGEARFAQSVDPSRLGRCSRWLDLSLPGAYTSQSESTSCTTRT